MLSMSVQPSIKGTLTGRPSSVFKNLCSAPLKTSFSVKPRAFCLHSLANSDLKIKPIRRIQRLPAAATEVAPAETLAETSESELAQEPEVQIQCSISFLYLQYQFFFFFFFPFLHLEILWALPLFLYGKMLMTVLQLKSSK